MSSVDFNNGLVVGISIAGKSGLAGSNVLEAPGVWVIAGWVTSDVVNVVPVAPPGTTTVQGFVTADIFDT